MLVCHRTKLGRLTGPITRYLNIDLGRRGEGPIVPTILTTIVDSPHFSCFFFNPFTPKSDHFQISSATLPEILRHTVWRTWLFIADLDEGLLH